ncbi:MAG: VTT domain-containing protein, partial [Candidatus Aenigmarchaeota archaeon]|nr:VTT domain-containing protein [Candidatus Aenigmarchaeota archaeon]
IRRRWIFKRNTELEKKAEIWFKRWGAITLLTLTWIPFIGDPITIVAGALKMPFKKFFTFILIAKMWTIAAIIAIAWFGLSAFGLL